MNETPDSDGIESHLLATLQSIAEFNGSWKSCADHSSREQLIATFHQSWPQWRHAQGQASVCFQELAPFFGLLAEPALRDLAPGDDRLKWWRDAAEAVRRPDLWRPNAFARYSAILLTQVSKGVVLEYYGQALRETGRPEAAHEVVEQAIQASQRLSPGLLNDRAVVLYSEHRFAEAEAACRRARDESEREGDQSNRAIAIGNLGMVVAELGDNQKALEYHEEARQLAEKHGFEELEANQIGNIGVIYMDLGLYDKSIEYIEDARRRHAAAGRRQAVLICDAELVRARFQAGRITHGQAVQDTHATHTKAADIGYFYVMVPPSHMTGTHPGTDAEIARAAARIEAAERSPSLWTRIRRIFD